MRLFIALPALLGAGCLAAPATGGAELPQWEECRLVGWRLTERPYGLIEDSWKNAEDGTLPPAEVALVYEALYRRPEKPPAETPIEPGWGPPCGHKVRASYEGPASQGVGNRVEMSFWVEGGIEAAHVVELSGSHGGMVVLDVRGAVPLAGAPGKYVVEGGAKAVVAFTSRVAGRGGIEVSVLGEVTSSPGGGGTSPAVREMVQGSIRPLRARKEKP